MVINFISFENVHLVSIANKITIFRKEEDADAYLDELKQEFPQYKVYIKGYIDAFDEIEDFFGDRPFEEECARAEALAAGIFPSDGA